MIIDLRQYPMGSAELRGQAESDIFELSDTDEMRPKEPHHYDIRMVNEEGQLRVAGVLRATFTMPCARCTERFDFEVILDGYLHVEETEGRAMIDLTDQFREDILLALPTYPHCDRDGGRSECPALAQLTEEEPDSSDEKEEGEPGVWDALDDWKP